MAQINRTDPIRLSQESIERVREYAIFLVDRDGIIASWNEGATLIKGYRPGDIIGKPFSLLFTEDDAGRGMPEEEMATAAREGRFEGYGKRRRKDGSVFDAHVVLTAIQDSRGALSGYLKLTRDITEEVRAKREIEFQQVWLKDFINRVPVAIFLLDSKGQRLIYANSAAAALTGIDFPAGEPLGTPGDVFRIKGGTGRLISLEEISPLQAVIKGRMKAVPMEWPLPKGKVSLVVSNELLPPLHGFPEILVVIMEDVTVIRQSEEKLHQAQKMEIVGRMAGGIAHDFNNLLTVIRGNAEILTTRLSPGDPAKDEIEEIHKAAEQATNLTAQLLAFSRKQVITPTEFDLNTVIANLEKLLVRVVGKGIRITTRLSPDIRLIRADRSQVEQVIMNLVINARDALEGDGEIQIRTENVRLENHNPDLVFPVRSGEYVKLVVKDSGLGIAPEVREHIFEPFFTTKDPGKGTGLGLSTVYGIVQEVHGNLSLESEPGRGAEFSVYFPLAGMQSPEPGRALTLSTSKRNGETILLAEDDKMVRLLISKLLQSQGYTVLEAEDGLKALKILDSMKSRPHLLLTDIIMPSMNGKDLAQKTLERYPDMPILFMSGYADVDAFREGMVSRPRQFIGKPFAASDLLVKVNELLSQSVSAS